MPEIKIKTYRVEVFDIAAHEVVTVLHYKYPEDANRKAHHLREENPDSLRWMITVWEGDRY